MLHWMQQREIVGGFGQLENQKHISRFLLIGLYGDVAPVKSL